MATPLETFQISAIIYPEADADRRVWIAQCLEFDIVSQGNTIEQVLNRLARNIAATVCVCEEQGLKPFEGIGEAPRRFWEMFEKATVIVDQEERPLRFPRPLPPIRPITKLIESMPA